MNADAGALERVLQIHTRYRQAGGEEQVVDAERRLLEGAGVEVRQVIFDNADVRESQSLIADARIALSAVWSRSAKEAVADAVRRHRPQVVHVHNTFMAASPSVYSAGAVRRVPVVQTLHNYRPACPSATAFRDGHACTDCVGRAIPWPSVVHACVRGSNVQSAVAAATITFHRARGTYMRDIHAYIALTNFQRQQLIVGGLPASRIRVVPNYLEPDPGIGRADRDGVLFAGRLSVEKGIATLIRAATVMPDTLSVVGGGPLADEVHKSAAAGQLTYFGVLPRQGVIERIQAAIAVVVPSIWFEGLPLVVLEAFATATPVIASRLGSLSELIDDGVTGLLVRPGDSAALSRAIRWSVDHRDEMQTMGLAARQRYLERYRGSSHLTGLIGVYESAIGRRAGKA
jgi:glycosyltransferase involved in cell wall biosynthesis